MQSSNFDGFNRKMSSILTSFTICIQNLTELGLLWLHLGLTPSSKEIFHGKIRMYAMPYWPSLIKCLSVSEGAVHGINHDVWCLEDISSFVFLLTLFSQFLFEETNSVGNAWWLTFRVSLSKWLITLRKRAKNSPLNSQKWEENATDNELWHKLINGQFEKIWRCFEKLSNTP